MAAGTPVVGVAPAAAFAQRPRLLAALAAAEGVELVAAPAGFGGLDAVLAFGADALAGAPNDLYALVVEEGAPAAPGEDVVLGDDPALARVLHGARLTDRTAGVLPQHDGLEVLARAGGAPAWARTSPQREAVAAPMPELGPDEALRDRLQPGCNLGLLAVASFLRRLRGATPSPLRAAFVLDDPNLHWPSYGHLRYADALAHAREHRYHLAIAMVPLDAWFALPRVAALFRAGSEQLSVCVHGNDHVGAELGRVGDDGRAAALAAQALARIEAFSRRTGVAVSRVMVPPHERVTAPVAHALRPAGFEALCTTRPYPWVADGPEHHWLARPEGAGPLAAWAPATVTDGLPILLRADFEHPFEDFVLRAFLGQPLIAYGHHDALRGGLERFAQLAGSINALGDVRWGSLGDIARAQAAALQLGPAPAPAAHRAAPRVRPWPVINRLARQGRDRLQPLRHG